VQTAVNECFPPLANAAASRPTCMFSLGGRVTRHGSALVWDRPSGWSRRSMQGQDLRAAPPQVRFEPKPTRLPQYGERLVMVRTSKPTVTKSEFKVLEYNHDFW